MVTPDRFHKKTRWSLFAENISGFLLKSITLTALLTLFLFNLQIHGQGTIPTKGKDFWLGFLRNPDFDPATKRLDIFISSDRNTSGTITIPQQGWSQSFIVVANVTTTINIPNINGEPTMPEIIDNKGIHIVTDDTVSVFAINFEIYSADATKVFPIQSIGNSYRITTYVGLSGYPAEFCIVAAVDGTQVRITPTVATSTGRPAGVPFLVNLNAGQLYMVQAVDSPNDFTGTTIVGTDSSGSCRPFAVFSGTACTNIPVGCTACDHIYDQDLPVRVWGTTYYTVGFDFATSYTFKILADKPGTVVQINGGAPINLNAGQSFEQNTVTTANCITSNNPIMVTQFMEGVTCAVAGDPAMLYLNAADQKIDNVTFSTITSTVITQHNVNVIMDAIYINQLTLDGAPVGAGQFTLFPSCPNIAYAQLSITQGSHTLKADSGFVAYVYGTGWAESYAYSVGSFSKKPPITIDSVLCSTDTMILGTLTPLFGPWWSTGTNPTDTFATGQTLTLTPPIQPDLYILHGDESMSGCSTELYYNVEIPTPPVTYIAQSTDTVCRYQQVQLQAGTIPASSIYLYSWTPALELSDPTIANPIATPLQSTWYVVAIQTPTGCGGVVYDSVFVFVKNGNISLFNVTPNDTLFCLGSSTQLNMNIQEKIIDDDFDPAPDAAIWSLISGGVSSNSCGSVTGSALYFNAGGSRSAATNALDLSAGGSIKFFLKIATGMAPCEDADFGEDVVLEYSTNAGANWSLISTYFEGLYPNFTLINIPIPAGAQTVATMIRWRQLTNSGVNQDNWSLDDILISKNNNLGYTYNWTPAAGLSSASVIDPTALPLSTTLYIGQATDNTTGCIYTDSVLIDVGQPFALNVSPDTSLCQITGVQIYAYPTSGTGYTYSWTPSIGLSNSGIADPIATPTSNTSYAVEISSPQGCVNRDTVNINVISLLQFNVTPNDTLVCTGTAIQTSLNISGSCGANGNICNGIPDSARFNSSILQGSTSSITPFSGTVNSGKHQYLYRASELQAAGMTVGKTIKSLGLDVAFINGSSSYQNFTIKIGCTSLSQFSNTFASGTVTVFNPRTITIVNGRNLFPFDNTYDWDGTSNLIIEFCFDNPGMSNNSGVYYQNIIFPCAIFSGGLSGECNSLGGVSSNSRPNMEFYTCTTQLPQSLIYTWSPPSEVSDPTIANPSLNPSITTTFQLVATDTITGCLFRDSVQIQVGTMLMSVSAPADSTVCTALGLQLNATHVATGTVTYSWQPSTSLTNSNTSSPTISVDGTQQFIVTITDSIGCTIARDSVDITVQSPPTTTITNDTTGCEGDVVQLFATGGVSYSWNASTSLNDSTIANPIATLTVPETFVVTVTDNIGCRTLDSVHFDIRPLPIVSIGNDVFVCNGTTVTMNAGNGFDTYLWQDFSTDSILSTTLPGQYFVQVTNQCGIDSDTLDVTVYDLPIINLGSDINQCFGATILLDALNPGSAFLWSDNSTTQTISITASGNFWVQITDVNTCSNSDTIDVTIDPLPSVSIGADTSLCLGQTYTIDAGNAGAAFHWSNGFNTQTIDVTSTDTYIVMVTDGNNCSNNDTIQVNFNAIPLANLNDIESICSGFTITLDAGNIGSSFIWTTGDTVQSITVSTSGIYGVQVMNSLSCIIIDSSLVVVNALPVVALIPDTTICFGTDITVDAGTTGIQYYWSTSETTQSIVVNTFGNYQITVTDGNGCTNQDNVNVAIQPLPVVNISNPDSIFCEGDSALFTATSPTGTQFQWLPNLFLSAPNSAITFAYPPYTLNYHLIVKDALGCKTETDVPLSFVFQPDIFLGSDTSFCLGDSIVLDAGSGYDNYTWQNGFHVQTMTINQSGKYWVEVNNFCGLMIDTIEVLPLYALPFVDLGPGGRICKNSQILFDAQNIGSQYLWSTGETTQIIEAKVSGLYEVVITNEHGCINSAGISIELVNPPNIELGTDPWLCFGELVNLNVKSDYSFYQWQDGSIDDNFTITSAGTYWVHVSSFCGEDEDTLTVNYYDCECQIFTPSAFTPNVDGKNEKFKAESVCELNSFELKIYNRWGELLFESDNINKGWDGTTNGTQAPESVYIFRITFEGLANRNIKSETIIGHVSLVR